MEAVALPGTGEIRVGRGASGEVEGGDVSLGADGTEAEERVLVVDAAEHAIGGDRLGAVNRDEIVFAVEMGTSEPSRAGKPVPLEPSEPLPRAIS